MPTGHLDRDTYHRLLAGELPPAEARAVAEHLERDCDTCEALLAELPPDGLDGRVDAALTAVAAAPAAPPRDDVAWARVRRAARGPAWTPTRAVAVAAALALAAGVSFQIVRSPRRDDAGVKGHAANVIPVRLRFAVVEGDPGQARLERGRSGAVVPRGASLAFRAEVGAPAWLALVRAGAGDREVVWRGRAAAAGAVDVAAPDGRPAAYPLRDAAGRQRFVLVAADAPLSDADLAAASSSGASAAASEPSPISIDVVEVEVR